jgi:hypothetical protein
VKNPSSLILIDLIKQSGVAAMPASQSEAAWFESWQGHWVPWRRIFVVFLSPSKQVPYSNSIGPQTFHSKSFPIHLSSEHSTLHSLKYQYKHYVSGHYPPSCLYLKTSPKLGLNLRGALTPTDLLRSWALPEKLQLCSHSQNSQQF